VTLLGVFGFCLIIQNVKFKEKANYAVASGFILAMLADAVIGQFWLFANQGDGYFPIARHVNWVIYIGSQTLLLLFPVAMIKTNVARCKA
jgi:Ca2+/H+ antiporter